MSGSVVVSNTDGYGPYSQGLTETCSRFLLTVHDVCSDRAVTDEELKISILVFTASLFAVNMIVICCFFFFSIYCVKIFRTEDSSVMHRR